MCVCVYKIISVNDTSVYTVYKGCIGFNGTKSAFGHAAPDT